MIAYGLHIGTLVEMSTLGETNNAQFFSEPESCAFYRDGANIDDAAPTAAHHPPCGILEQFNHRTNIQIEVPVVGVIDTFEEGTVPH